MATKFAETPAEKKERYATKNALIHTHRMFHQPLFNALGAPEAFYDCRSMNIGKPKEPYFIPEARVGFFPSMLDKGEDIYFELTNFDWAITDPTRTLYKLKGNPHYKSDTDKYDYREKTHAGSQYYVALEDCEIVSFPTVFMDEFAVPVPKEDMALDKLTARDRVCVDLKVPDSSHEWINELIRKSL